MAQKIKLIYLAIIIFMLEGCAGVYRQKVNIIRLKGSDTMLLLATHWAEAYMQEHPAVSVYVEGGGSAIGLKSLIQGEIDIATASRPIQAHEARQLAEKYGRIGMGFLVAKDALSVYLNPANPVRNLTISQLKAIFSGAITHWETLGGKNRPIHTIIRAPNSGTYLYFKEHVLDGAPYTAFARTIVTTNEIVTAISANPDAIGYGGIAFGENIIHCKIDTVAPTEENVRNDSYPIVRYLYLYTIDTPQREVKAFIDWVLKDGQKVVKQVGYIPIWQAP
ncbi:phosphate ABC transporter substrate-binding protein [candidate division KSB1 bacterium]|nr:phosphate ABC transporter substrate-binding protein [candidate division KSB1 bacterium]